MPKRSSRTQKFISIQSTALFRVVFASLTNALRIYRKNRTRPPVASSENGESSTAILLTVTALESHVNRLMYFELKGLSTKDNLSKKLKTYLPQRKYNKLLRETDEITACRDAIAHAHVYEENQNFDADWNLTKRSWKVAEVTQLLGKTRRVIMKREPVSALLRVNLMPTSISYVDGVKALVTFLGLCESSKRDMEILKLGLDPALMNLLQPEYS